MIFSNNNKTVIIQVDSWTMHSLLEDDILDWALTLEGADIEDIANLDLHEGGSCSVEGGDNNKTITLSGDNGVMILNEIEVNATFS